MKKVLIVVAAILLCLFIISYFNARPDSALAILAKKGASPTGDLKYRVYLLGILPVGEAVLYSANKEDYQAQPVYHLRAEARSLKIFSKFFSGFAVLDSYIDTVSFNPRLFKQKVKFSGKPDINKEVFYDQDGNVMALLGVKRQIMPNTQDPLSLIYKFRHMDFDKVKDFDLSLNTNQKNYMIKGTASVSETSLSKVIYKTALVNAEIRRRDKNPYHKSRISILFLKGRENVPLLIKVIASGFLINAKLVEIK
ncbi:MAG: DUF3108 domain-containing protein [Candidatus Omnitrophica bacterium]|nr:DUF3108 domain-containing protein [Candidatus Omnitrophota bacterium]